VGVPEKSATGGAAWATGTKTNQARITVRVTSDRNADFPVRLVPVLRALM
jgi:hypothetical protein